MLNQTAHFKFRLEMNDVNNHHRLHASLRFVKYHTRTVFLFIFIRQMAPYFSINTTTGVASGFFVDFVDRIADILDISECQWVSSSPSGRYQHRTTATVRQRTTSNRTVGGGLVARLLRHVRSCAAKFPNKSIQIKEISKTE